MKAEDVVLAILCAYRTPITLEEIEDRVIAWDLCGHFPYTITVGVAMTRLFEQGHAADHSFTQYVPTDAGRAACPSDVLPLPLTFTYRNHRGEVSERRVLPIRVYFGECEYHAGAQWLLVALDVEKGEDRTFALRDVQGGML